MPLTPDMRSPGPLGPIASPQDERGSGAGWWRVWVFSAARLDWDVRAKRRG